MNNAKSSARILLVGRESFDVNPLWSLSKLNSWQLEIASSGLEVVERLDSELPVDLVLLEISSLNADGLHILRWLHRTHPELSVILLLDQADEEKIMEASPFGVHDRLIKPYRESELDRTIKLHLSARYAHYEAEIYDDDQIDSDLSLISGDPAIQKLRTRAEQLAQLDVPVLLLGEGRNSKEVVARLIHKLSARSGFEFLKVNCGDFAPDVLRRELFGYQRRNISGGLQLKEGKFALCNGGTMLLDELAEMPVSLQSEILQFLESNQSLHPGNGSKPEIDVRVIAAVNVDVEKALAEKKLSEDLYYRLSGFTLYVPRLKEVRKHSNGEDPHGLKSLVRTAKGEAEKKAITVALEETRWNRKAAARLLRISYRALLYKIQEYEMRPPDAYISRLAPVNGYKGNGRAS